MAYDGKVMREALQRFEEDKQRRASQAAARRQRIYREVPRLEEIEQQLRGTMGRIMAQALRRGEDPVPAIQRLRAENLSLQQERAQLLTAHGYPADALVDKPRCVLCGDTGYCGGRICACLQKYYAQEQIRSLSSLLDVGSQSFDTFGLEWYDTQPGESGRSPRQLMERNLATCQRYAAEFGKKPANLLRSMLGKEDESIRMEFDDKNVTFRLKSHTLICRLIEGNYPNYNAVIPSNNPNHVRVDRVELLNGIRRVAVCSNQSTNLIKMDIESSTINLTAQDLDFSVSAQESLACEYEGEAISIGFKSTFLVEILANIDTQNVVLELADSTRAGVFKPIYDEAPATDTLMLLMPMMINS